MNRQPRAAIANPGANANVTIFDSNDSSPGEDSVEGAMRAKICIDQNFTLNRYWAASHTSPLRLVSSTAYTAGSGGHVGSVHASQPITCVAKANLVNNDYFTVTYTTVIDGVTVATEKVFEYQVDGTFVATVDRLTIDASAATTATSVAVLTAAAIAAAFVATATQPALTVAVPTTAVLTINAQSGPRFAIGATENVANAGFLIGVAVTGVEGSVVVVAKNLGPGRDKFVIVTGTAPTEFDVAVDGVDDLSSGA